MTAKQSGKWADNGGIAPVREKETIPTDGKERITWIEVLILGAILLASLIVFSQPDLIQTAVSSTALLKGHWLDFYEYNDARGLGDSYFPSTYFVFAIWSAIPYLFGGLRTYSEKIPTLLYLYLELLPVLVYMASGYVTYKIARVLKLPVRRARLVAYSSMTIPVALYSQFIFCQYDIFTVFLVLLGTYYYLKNNDKGFVICFALSFPFKYFSMAIFVPMLFLRHKNWLKIFAWGFASLVPIALSLLIHYHDPSFVHRVLNFSALSYVTASAGNVGTDLLATAGQALGSIGAGMVPMVSASVLSKSLVIVRFGLAAVICVWAYLTNPKTKMEKFKWVSFFGSLMFFAVFGFMKWHPQWLLTFLPFWGISGCLGKTRKYNAILAASDVLFMIVFVMYVSNNWFRELDQGLLKNGALSGLLGDQVGTEYMVKDFYHFYSIKVLKMGTGFMMLVQAILRYPSFLISKSGQFVSKGLLTNIRLRWAIGLGSFLVPVGICVFYALGAPYCTFNGEDFAGHLPGITADQRLEQVFTVQTDDAEYLEFYAYNYDRENTGTLVVSVVDMNNNNNTLAQEKYDLSTFPNRGWFRMDLKDRGLKAGGKYMLVFHDDEGTNENSVTLYHTHKLTNDPNYYGLYNETPLGSNLSVKIFEGSRPQE